MKLGRFIVDTHVHAQRLAAGKALRARGIEDISKVDYKTLSDVLRDAEAYDNSPRLLYDMECYGVDMCVLVSAYGMSNAMNLDLMERYPDKFVAITDAKEYEDHCEKTGEEWTIKGVCEYLDKTLATKKFVGIGEVLPHMRPNTPVTEPLSRETVIKNCLQVMEVARAHKVSVHVHAAGATMGYRRSYSAGSSGPSTFNPLWVLDLAYAFPDVPIIIAHGGVAMWWWEKLYEECLYVAASHDNVYLETGLWWADLYNKALNDPNIGAEKLLWGTDWGASIPIYEQRGVKPETYPMQVRKQGVVRHQVDVMGWSQRQLLKLEVTQDEMNLILGGNAVRIWNLKTPHSRLFQPKNW